jgi:hypothetical protein
MANESPQVSRYHALVDSPQEYHNITDLLDLFELIFRHHITIVMDKELWPRWESTVKSVMTIPKVKRVWEKTKQFHTPDYVKFIDY